MTTSSKPRSVAGSPTRAETLLEKTTRAAKEIIDDQTEQRDRKTERLREARLEREAGTAVDAADENPKSKGKTARAKPAKTS